VSISTAFTGQSTSTQLVLAGTTPLQGDSIGGVQSVAPTVSALNGWEITESTGAAVAKVRIWDGTGTGAGNYLRAAIDLIAGGESIQDASSPIQILNGGLYLQVVSGSVDGEIRWTV
jgi:hypothetical protein